MTSLTGRVVVITGGAGAIGCAGALRLAEAGASIVLGDVRAESAVHVAEQIRAAGGDAVSLGLDVTDESEVNRFFDQVAVQSGRIDILINNAGVYSKHRVLDLTLEEWLRVLHANLTSAFLCSRAALRYMIPQRSGVIINMSSDLGWKGGIGVSPYAAAKAGLIGLTRSLALEVGAHGIRVNAIAPGVVDTPMPRSVMSEEEVQRVGSQNALGRIGSPNDIAEVVLFLAGDGSRHVTGQAIHVNGGAYFP